MAFVLWILAWQLTSSTMLSGFVGGSPFRFYGRMACYGLLFVREVAFGTWDRKALVGGLVLGAMGVSVWFCGSMYALIDGLFLLFAARNVPFKKILAASCATLAAVTFSTTILSLVGVLPNHTLDASRGGRYFLGFAWPNTGPAIYLFVVCAYVAFRDKRLNPLEGIVLLVIAFWYYRMTDCRSAFYAAAVVVVGAVVIRYLPDKVAGWKPFQVMAIASLSAIAVASIALSAFYDPGVGWMHTLNSALSGRLSLCHWAISTYGISVLGQPTDFTGLSRYSLVTGEWLVRENAHPIDCLYVHAAVREGLVFTVLGIALCTAAMVRAARRRQWIFLFVIVCIAVYGIMEKMPFYPYYNAFLFLISDLFAVTGGEKGAQLP